MAGGVIPIGERLTATGVVSPGAVAAALEEQQRTGSRLGEILLASGDLRADQLAPLLAEQWGLPWLDDGVAVAPESLGARARLEARRRSREDRWRGPLCDVRAPASHPARRAAGGGRPRRPGPRTGAAPRASSPDWLLFDWMNDGEGQPVNGFAHLISGRPATTEPPPVITVGRWLDDNAQAGEVAVAGSISERECNAIALMAGMPDLLGPDPQSARWRVVPAREPAPTGFDTALVAGDLAVVVGP